MEQANVVRYRVIRILPLNVSRDRESGRRWRSSDETKN